VASETSNSLAFQFTCKLPNGLHARPASHLADIANGFASAGTLINLRNGVEADLKSVLAMIAADVRAGDECVVRIEGRDDATVFAYLQSFIERDLPECDEPLAAPAPPGSRHALPRGLQAAAPQCHFGIPVSRGIASGATVIVGGIAPPQSLDGSGDPERENERLRRALAAVRTRMEALLLSRVSSTETAVLKAHLALLGDVSFHRDLFHRAGQGRTAGQAVSESGAHFSALLRRSDNLYIRERAIDIQEICLQLLDELYGNGFQPAPVQLREPSIVVAENLAPRQLLGLDHDFLKGVVLESAAVTSHVVILARSMSIPAVVGLPDAHVVLAGGQEVVLDAGRGVVVPLSAPGVRRFYEREEATERRRSRALAEFCAQCVRTTDGCSVEVGANIGSAAELEAAFRSGADGIGLFRTEMLFVGRDEPPSEGAQFEIYRRAVETAGDRPVVIRTLDIGGDKPLGYLNLRPEKNPFLGNRGVRLYAAHQELVSTQLRAILRASAYGRIQMMLPMISSVEEVVWFKGLLASVREELAAERTDFDPAMKLGAMIETPAAGFAVDGLAKELDFFSLGTNDLSQYFFAADRENADVVSLSNVRHPGFLRFLKQIVDDARKRGRPIGVCGDMSGHLANLPLLIGLHLDSLSVPAAELPAIKERISKLSAAWCDELLSQAIACGSVSEVHALLESCESLERPRPLLERDMVLLGASSEDKEEAIRDVVDALYISGRIEDRDRMEEALWAREAVYSTGLGHGFAVPHCKSDAVSSNSIGILKPKRPIEWNSLDGEPVRMVILLALRETGKNGSHMQVFSRLARKLMNEEFRERLLSADDPASLVSQLGQELDAAV
jgi:multiphosphoryl transfer protein